MEGDERDANNTNCATCALLIVDRQNRRHNVHRPRPDCAANL